MSAIDIVIEPHRVTRVFFDCRDIAHDSADRRRIEQAIKGSIALAEADCGPPETLLLAA
jgi:hypothetical protein